MVNSLYSDKLKDPRWQKRRLEVFERDNWKCTNCGNDKNELQVHHRYYIAGIEPWEYPHDVLATLCKSCHDNEFARWKYEQYLLHTLNSAGFSAFEILALSCLTERYNGFRLQLKKLIQDSVELGL